MSSKENSKNLWEVWEKDLRRDSLTPLYMRLADCFENAINQGVWLPFSQLPSIREISKRLAVSKNTVSAAYDFLAVRGVIFKEAKKRAVVQLPIKKTPDWYSLAQPHVQMLSPIAKHHQRQNVCLDNKAINLSHRMVETWDNYEGTRFLKPFMNKVFVKISSGAYKNIYDEQGFIGLREELTHYLKSTYNIVCSPKEILICSRRMQIYNLLSEVFLSPNIFAGLEKINFLNFYRVGISRVAQRIFLPINQNGLNIEPLKAIHNSRFLFIQPSHSEPSGTVTDMKARREILNYCGMNRIPIVEDGVMDPLYENEGRNLQPMKSIDTYGNVIYIGGVHGPLSPGLSLDWVVAPIPVIQLLLAAVRREAQFPSELNQLILYEVLQKQALNEYFLQESNLMTIKRKTFEDVVQHYLGDVAEWSEDQCFGRLWITFKDPISVSVLYNKGKSVDFFPGSFYGDESDRSILLYLFEETEIFEEGIQRLRALIDSLF